MSEATRPTTEQALRAIESLEDLEQVMRELWSGERQLLEALGQAEQVRLVSQRVTWEGAADA